MLLVNGLALDYHSMLDAIQLRNFGNFPVNEMLPVIERQHEWLIIRYSLILLLFPIHSTQ